ncbi:TetR/AcrR family transcriptional regulator [Phenylobacterium sp.]|uniref:TetR/AcrR family transcriptional regulator n=1 Tax=Phenylobacterium sp. TaxID=1871053 RepID=UPI0035AE0C59
MAAPPVVAPRKRPAQGRARQTVAAILEGAARILETEGLEGFNTNAVAGAAGVSVGSLYQYFPGKDAIMAGLIRREAQAFRERLDEAARAASGPPLAEAIAVLAATAVAHQAARPRLARILDFEERRLGLSGEAEDADAGVAAILSAFLAERGFSGPNAAGDAMHIARGLIDGALERGAVEDLERRVAAAVLGYLQLMSAAPGQEAPSPSPAERV